MLTDDVIDWHDNKLDERFKRTYHRKIVALYIEVVVIFIVAVAIFYTVMVRSQGAPASFMNNMVWIIALAVVITLVLIAGHKIRWGRAMPSRIGLASDGIWFEYGRGRRVFVSVTRILGTWRFHWKGLDENLIVHWGFLPIPDGKFADEEITQLVTKRFHVRQLSNWLDWMSHIHGAGPR